MRRESRIAAPWSKRASRPSRIDVLHNNVGIGTGDGSLQHLTEETWDQGLQREREERLSDVQARHPSCASRKSGAVINVSSIASVCAAPPWLTRRQGAVNAFTHGLAMANAK